MSELKDTVQLLVNSLLVLQSRGTFSFYNSYQVLELIKEVDTLFSENTLDYEKLAMAVNKIIKVLEQGQSKGGFKIEESATIYTVLEKLKKLFDNSPIEEEKIVSNAERKMPEID